MTDPKPLFLPAEDRLPLLRCLLLPQAEARAEWRAWRAAHDLEALVDPRTFSLMPLVYRRLLALGESDPQLPILKGLYKKTWFRNHVLQRGFFQAVDVLGRAGIPVMAIKGVAALRYHGGDSGVRPMMDTDFMIPHADVARAIDALCADGWVAKPAASAETLKAGLAARHHGWNFRRGDGEIDVHWHLLPQDLSPAFDRLAWQHRQTSVVWGREVAVPSPTDHLIQAFVHAAGHSVVPSSVWAADAAHIVLRAGADVDWDRLVALTVERRLILPVRDALDVPVPAAPLARLGAAPVFDAERLEYEANMLHALQHSALHHKARRHMREARLATGAETAQRAAISLAALDARPVAAVTAPAAHPRAAAPAGRRPSIASTARRAGLRLVTGWRQGPRRG